MKAIALALAVAALSLARDDTPESELDKYQGTWVLVSEEFEGKKVPAEELAEDLKNLSYAVRGDKLLYTSNGEERSVRIRLDPSKSPRTFDLLPDGDGRPLQWIYAWEGFKTLKVCSADDRGERPKEFKTGPGSRNRIRVWKRKP